MIPLKKPSGQRFLAAGATPSAIAKEPHFFRVGVNRFTLLADAPGDHGGDRGRLDPSRVVGRTPDQVGGENDERFVEIDSPRRGLADRHGAGSAGAICLGIAAGREPASLWAKAQREPYLEAGALSEPGRLCDEPRIPPLFDGWHGPKPGAVFWLGAAGWRSAAGLLWEYPGSKNELNVSGRGAAACQ